MGDQIVAFGLLLPDFFRKNDPFRGSACFQYGLKGRVPLWGSRIPHFSTSRGSCDFRNLVVCYRQPLSCFGLVSWPTDIYDFARRKGWY